MGSSNGKNINREHAASHDEACDIFWCRDCQIPIIHESVVGSKIKCPACGSDADYLCADIRPVFPEERLLAELLLGKEPNGYVNSSVWANGSRYYIDGHPVNIGTQTWRECDVTYLQQALSQHKHNNSAAGFSRYINLFIKANKNRLDSLTCEATQFIEDTRQDYEDENIVISFSGGKDSTVVADLVVRSLRNPSVVHVFGDTTLEFPSTIEYVNRYRIDHPMAIVKTAKNQEQDFYSMADEIGPPSRVMRWCCSMFKTGPITRVYNSLYNNKQILSFYGIRKCESVQRSKYNRIEDDASSVKILNQKVASPIFYWKDIDIWLYLLSNDIDFNDAYRLGYDRVGCWCCPNNNVRAEVLSEIYMPNEYARWKQFLIRFAKRIGKPDPDIYVEQGNWKARQGGNGLSAAESVKLRYSNCTTDENAFVFALDRPYSSELVNLMTPFGHVAPELGRKLLKETIIVDRHHGVPLLSIQPFDKEGIEYSVKIKILQPSQLETLKKQVGYQVRKYNACRQCLKCESLCGAGAISILAGEYRIEEDKCIGCMKCTTNKYLRGGCLMQKYLGTRESDEV